MDPKAGDSKRFILVTKNRVLAKVVGSVSAGEERQEAGTGGLETPELEKQKKDVRKTCSLRKTERRKLQVSTPKKGCTGSTERNRMNGF